MTRDEASNLAVWLRRDGYRVTRWMTRVGRHVDYVLVAERDGARPLVFTRVGVPAQVRAR